MQCQSYIIAYYSTVFISESISEENRRHNSEMLIHVEIKKLIGNLEVKLQFRL